LTNALKDLGNAIWGINRCEIGVREGGARRRKIDAYRTHYMGALHYHIGDDPFGAAPDTHTARDFQKYTVDYRYGDDNRCVYLSESNTRSDARQQC
jgi:hypothetical protein